MLLDGGRVGAFVRGQGEEEDDDQEDGDEKELKWVAVGREHDRRYLELSSESCLVSTELDLRLRVLKVDDADVGG